MKLNHRQLEAFRALIETGSVTEASKRMFITQPAVSRLIADLEHVVGYSLFLREKKRLFPTPEALALFDEVDRSFIGLNTIFEAAKEIGTFRRGVLRLVSLPAMAMPLAFLPRMITQFCQDKPEISVSLQTHSSQRVLQSIASQQFDIGFAEINSDHPGVSTEPLYDAPMVAILPKGHSLLSKSTLTPEDFSGENFVSLGSEYMTRKRIDAVFLANNITRKMQVETQLSMAVGNMVACGAGVSIIDKVTAHSLHALGLVEIRPFLPEINYCFQVLTPAHKPLSRLWIAFLDIVHQHLEKLDDHGSFETT